MTLILLSPFSGADLFLRFFSLIAALRLAIKGHTTDNSGDAQHNKALSQQRADAVMAALLVKGKDKGCLSTSGLGADQPIADNDNDQGRAKSRRVELVKQS
ncbi:OmpA family protein [Collimonas pratensis]|uniref:OmpA family protein n=1 Tax=Collimonas pratensis TaxID=279113 RepID=UPI0018D4D495|nr:OmpA family protein [Collimonas pratensis]